MPSNKRRVRLGGCLTCSSWRAWLGDPIPRRERNRSVTARVASCVLLVACWGAVSAGPAVAGWSAATPVEKGVDPILVFGPSGDAAIGSSVMHDGDIGATFLARRAPHRRFGRPQRFGPVQDLGAAGTVALQAIALPSDGAAAALFGSYSIGPIKAFVQPRGARRFGAAQQIVKLGDANGDSYQADSTTVVDTTRGEVVEAGQDDSGNASTATLAKGSTRFVVTPTAPGQANVGQQLTLATDDAGGTFLTGEYAGCPTVAYRPARGGFRIGYQASCATIFDAATGIAATGDGYAALLTKAPTTVGPFGPNEPGSGPNTLSVQVGRFGQFGAPTLVSSDFPDPPGFPPNVGIAIDRDGSVTVAWNGCATGNQACGVYGKQGSVYTGFAGQPTLIAASAPHARLLVADGAVGVQQCAAHRRCTIAVALARADRQFTRPQQIPANGGRLLALQSDDRGDLLVVWSTNRNVLYAATRASGGRRLSAPHRLSKPGAHPGAVTAAFGPRGEAIVAWSQSGRTIASVYASRAR